VQGYNKVHFKKERIKTRFSDIQKHIILPAVFLDTTLRTTLIQAGMEAVRFFSLLLTLNGLFPIGSIYWAGAQYNNRCLSIGSSFPSSLLSKEQNRAMTSGGGREVE
jgi:hypothetical protein